ncbi:hypothetical protein V4F39_12625 [Aquincola sp. MAHUQ-54]|uniref:Uncharacterized protein n=1 Tax=Aquincola agrisoli TaxID=3119538 RepID=A0AAW9QGJ8_9BURK
MQASTHPVFERLTAAQSPMARQHLLHELEKMVDSRRGERALVQRVHQVVERGVPYYAPADAHYQAWARQVAELWQRAEALPA